jgi:hypothetical protein
VFAKELFWYRFQSPWAKVDGRKVSDIAVDPKYSMLEGT